MLDAVVIKCISFDLDGTLVSEEFDFIIWNVEIPKLYAREYQIDLETAKTKVFAEYYKALYIEKVKNWTDIDMWFRRLGLTDFQKLMADLKHTIHPYHDSIEVLEDLKSQYMLIIVSSAEKHFFDLKLEITGVREHFDHVFSAPTDFGIWKKDAATFRAILERLKLKPEEVVHVGNELQHDYTTPASLGIHAYLIDRDGKSHGEHIIHSLRELKGKL
jgi:5'-nucleotidase